MKRLLSTWPIHPFLFAAYPVLLLYSVNLALIPIGQIYRPLAAMLAAVLVVFLVVAAIVRDFRRAALAATVALVEFFTFQQLWNLWQGNMMGYFGITRPSQFLGLWTPGAVAVLVLIVWKWRKGLDVATGFLNVVGICLFLLPTITIVLGLLKIKSELAQLSLPQKVTGGTASAGSLPDIFYVILDGYGREDAVQHYFGYSNRDFIQALEKRGFYVPEQSRSNYCQTELSLASSLNMDFVRNLVPGGAQQGMSRAPLDRLLDRSKVAAFLRSRGYEYVAVTSGFPGVEPKSSDLLLVGRQGYSLLESSLISETPLLGSAGAVESQYKSRRDDLLAAFSNWEGLATPGNRPRFVFVHILAPHPPFVLDARGNAIVPSHTTFGYWDASAFFAVGGTQREYHDGYLGQLRYVNGRVLEAVDRILAQAASPPVIILQGDHGSREFMSQDSLGQTDVRECFRNLNAFLVPKAVRERLYSSITPVNSFRILLNGLFNQDFALEPDTSYYTTWEQPYRPIDVTKQVLVSLKEKMREPNFTGTANETREESE